jgi:LysM repeat protein
MKLHLLPRVKCLALALLVAAVGCAYVGEKVDMLRKPAHHVHTVRWPGETLSIIAKWYTGRLENWRAIARANPELDPDRITMGAEVRIPKDLLKTEDPMPRDFVASFAAEKPPTSPEPKRTFLRHTVRWPGETLSIIAKWYTGSLDNWKALANANPKLDPKRITMGTKIRIPEEMLQTTDPMPQDFVASFGQRPETSSTDQDKAEEGEDEKPMLFGPKRYPAE